MYTTNFLFLDSLLWPEAVEVVTERRASGIYNHSFNSPYKFDAVWDKPGRVDTGPGLGPDGVVNHVPTL